MCILWYCIYFTVRHIVESKYVYMYMCSQPAEEAAKEKMHRAHSTVQHKIPMPNMVSVIVKEHISGQS